MAKKSTTWGGVRINTSKTPKQIVDQLNKTYHDSNYVAGSSPSTMMRVFANESNIRRSAAAKRHGVEYDYDSGEFYLNKKGRMGDNIPIAAMGGSNG